MRGIFFDEDDARAAVARLVADGYAARAENFVRTARTLVGMAEEEEYLTRAAEAYRQAIDRYSKVTGYQDVPRSLRQSRRALRQVQLRIAELHAPSEEPPWP